MTMKGSTNSTVLHRADAIDPGLQTNVVSIAALDDLDDITRWLGTFRIRLEVARETERQELQAALGDLETRYRQRRAELA
jgi:hypothetical protein